MFIKRRLWEETWDAHYTDRSLIQWRAARYVGEMEWSPIPFHWQRGKVFYRTYIVSKMEADTNH